MESFLGQQFVEDRNALSAIAMALLPPRILIVDDEHEIVEEIAECLSDEGMEVTCTTTVRDAIAALRRNPYFMVVITDLRMPELDGLDLIRALEHTKGLTRLVAQGIVLTGHATDEQLAAATDAGAARVLRKPCSLDDLLREVSAACSAARLAAQRFSLSDR